MRVLYVTTVGITMIFFKSFVRHLLDKGHTVDIATNETESLVPQCYRDWGCKVYHIETSRSPLNKGNFTAIKQINKIVRENGYNIVHCHTPLAGICTRLACRKLRDAGVKVLYTAHGFHFYKGAPIKNWLLYYTAEKICAPFTDVLITINKEDFTLAQKKMKSKRVEYVPGVGIDLEKFSKPTVNKVDKRRELGIPEDAVLLLSVGELIKRKNHETIIRAIADVDTDVYCLIAGDGILHTHLQSLIDHLGISDRVKLIGYRNDVKEIYEIADLFVFPSFQEGLPVSVMEAMASGLPCIVSNIRGNVDLINDGINGFLCDPNDATGFSKCIEKLLKDRNLMKSFSLSGKETIMKYDIKEIIDTIQNIYQEALSE